MALQNGWNFNCTIQELKQIFCCDFVDLLRFQLHHTGIKTSPPAGSPPRGAEFQLHHTGIKTKSETGQGSVPLPFQLHHTGIKTSGLLIRG